MKPALNIQKEAEGKSGEVVFPNLKIIMIILSFYSISRLMAEVEIPVGHTLCPGLQSEMQVGAQCIYVPKARYKRMLRGQTRHIQGVHPMNGKGGRGHGRGVCYREGGGKATEAQLQENKLLPPFFPQPAFAWAEEERKGPTRI